MAEGLTKHPILAYFTFVLPAILLVLEIMVGANVFVLALTLLWFGVAFGVLYLPLAGDNGSKA